MVTDPAIYFENAVTGYRHVKRTVRLTHAHGLGFLPGDFVAVAGANGSGKSTLLRSICGLQPLLEGSIALLGRPVKEYESWELARRVAIVLTHRVGGFNLRVRDAVATGLMPYTNAFHRMEAGHWARVDECMERCGIAAHAQADVEELSDGMFQKTMIARALAQQTQVLLLDEPSAFLDYPSKHELFRLLAAEAAGKGKCILISTHELDHALRYCNKLLLLENGGARVTGTVNAASDEGLRKISGGYLGTTS